MKETIIELLEAAGTQLKQQGILPADAPLTVKVEPTKDKAHGDYASNLALTLAKPAGRKPRDLAEALVAALPPSDAIRQVDIAGPGFINFFAATDAAFSASLFRSGSVSSLASTIFCSSSLLAHTCSRW